MKKTLLSIIAATLLAAIPCARAGEPALDTTVTLGYDSRYVLYGYRLSRHLYHADVNLYYPLNEQTSVWGGGWYGYLTDGTYQELDIYGGIDRMLTDTVSVGLAYSIFNYLEVPFTTADNAQEFAAHVSRATERLFLSVRNQYDTEAEGSLLRGIAEFTQPLTDTFAISLGAEAGFAFEYYIDGNLWNHALFKIKAPYQVTPDVSLTPFIAHSIVFAAIDDFEDDETYYGISAGMGF